MVIVRRRIGDLAAVVARESVGSGPITLEVRGEPKQYTFAYRAGEATSRILAEGATRYLSKEVAGGFTGVYVAMYATGHGLPAASPADFDWFEYAPTEQG